MLYLYSSLKVKPKHKQHKPIVFFRMPLNASKPENPLLQNQN
jgi:hypothetical protein